MFETASGNISYYGGGDRIDAKPEKTKNALVQTVSKLVV
jgi:hypothetical protein